MKKNKAFTLIELIAVLVILAIISLIVAPLILNTVRRVKDVANKRSIDGYGRAVEYAISNYELKQLPYPDSFDELEIDYHGNKVECETSRINPDHTIYLSKCKVNGKLVKDDKEVDGYYHYGILKMTNQEYVDTYGKNLEEALKNYHDEHNEYPSDYTTLTLPPLDKEVRCDVKINYEGSVYLTKCSVNEDEIVDENTKDNYYHYGTKKYGIGDEVEYNGIEFYVINNSNDDSDSVTMLKKTQLSASEINLYGGSGTENNHVNKYTSACVGYAYPHGGMAYYSSENCGKVEGNIVSEGCTSDYGLSDVKYVIDAWAVDKFREQELVSDSTGYSARLLTVDELHNNLGYGNKNVVNENVPEWVYSTGTWTFPYNSSSTGTLLMTNGKIIGMRSYEYSAPVRPVITLKKSALE